MSRKPPRLAAWLIARLSRAYCRDALIGDLAEEYGRGRSHAWYWLQALQAIASAAFDALQRQHWLWALRLLTIWTLLIGASVGEKWPLFLIALDPSLYGLMRRRIRHTRRDRCVL